MKKILILSLLVFSHVLLMQGQNKLETKKINIFKNGSYYVIKSGQVQMTKQEAIIETPVSPLLSSFWILPQNNIRILQHVFYTDTLKKEKAVKSLQDVIFSNNSKQVNIYYQMGEDVKEANGKLSAKKGSSVISLLSKDGKTSYIPLTTILSISVQADPVESYKADSIARVCKLIFDKDMRSVNVDMIYMQSGIQWIPMYRINILSENELHLELKAIVENYAEDIKNAEISLTVGDPQFFWGKQLDPISTNYLSNFFYQNATYPSGYAAPSQMSNAYYAAAEMEERMDYNLPNNQTYNSSGEKSGDLYVFNLGKGDLPKNSKSSFEIFGQKIPYEDVYEVSIPDVANLSSNRYLSIDKEKTYDVFHSLKLQNTTKQPFTTAPVFVLDKNDNPLAQDRIKYTAVGSKVSVQLSKAFDISVKNNEEEIEVVQSFKKINKTSYNKVIVKGSIDIQNLQDKKIRLDITKELKAEVSSASNNGTIKKTGKYYNYNPYSSIEWTINIGANEKKTISYEYYVLISQ